ncbi:MAG: hypothetical protein RIR52_1942, partial [Acidobacteriota bacterium]
MNGKRVLRLTQLGVLTLLSVGAALVWPSVPAGMQQRQAAVADPFRDELMPFLSENCYGCHNEKKAAGGLNLEQYREASAILAQRETWESVLARVEAGEMPPKGVPRPDEAALKRVTAWLTTEFRKADERMAPNPGRVTARRLNRSEYNNTVRDLLGVDLQPAADFPQDDTGYGFDTIGDVLSLPPVLMEKYLTAAERVSEA